MAKWLGTPAKPCPPLPQRQDFGPEAMVGEKESPVKEAQTWAAVSRVLSRQQGC